MPAAVVFAIGSKPGLSAHQANDLAELLALGRNSAAIELAGRVRQQAAVDFDSGEVSVDIVLDRAELEQIAAVFAEGPDLLDIPAFAHLNDEVLAALGRTGPITYRAMHDHDVISAGDARDRGLARELRALEMLPAEALAVRIEEALESEERVLDVDDALALEQLARALDHRRNAAGSAIGTPDEERSFPRAHADLRDHLIGRLGFRPITYRLSGWDQPPAEFWSYTGVYSDGDRIVTGDGRAWRAVTVSEGERGQPGSIDVEPWRRR
jgi:hypothetical protein